MSTAWLVMETKRITEPGGTVGSHARIAATSVDVFPVPGGPWMKEKMWFAVAFTAIVCGPLRRAVWAAWVRAASSGALRG